MSTLVSKTNKRFLEEADFVGFVLEDRFVSCLIRLIASFAMVLATLGVSLFALGNSGSKLARKVSSSSTTVI